MELNQISIFQILTRIELTLKAYHHNQFEHHQIVQICKELQNIHLSPQTIFQQLIPDKEKNSSLKFTLFNSLFDSFPAAPCSGFQIQNLEKIKPHFESSPNIENASEILRKISAIKSQIMFVNQQLSIQPMVKNYDDEISKNLENISLRKLIKEYMKRSRKNSKLQFLVPISIRLVVLQESIMIYLEKTLKLFSSLLILNDESYEKIRTSNQSSKSVSSLSASIEQYLERKNNENQQGVIENQASVEQCSTLRPIIRSSFFFGRVETEQYLIAGNDTKGERKCCLWF